jgi:uncharacterized protein
MAVKPEVALVTGASSGIGEAFCHELAGRGCDLVLVARRQHLLESLRDKLQNRYGCRAYILVEDLGDPESPDRIFAATQAWGLTVDTLINNAGYGLSGAFSDRSWQEHQQYLQVMCLSPTHLFHLYLPGMIERNDGRVLNVASFSSYFAGSPYLPLYAAIKHYVLVMSQTVHAELQGSGVTVTALCPGGTKTDWFEKAESTDAIRALPGFMFLSAAEVARCGCRAMLRGKMTVVPGFWATFTVLLSRLIPARTMVMLIARGFKKGRD